MAKYKSGSQTVLQNESHDIKKQRLYEMFHNIE